MCTVGARVISAGKHLGSRFIKVLAHNAAVVTCVHSCEDVESLESHNPQLCAERERLKDVSDRMGTL